MIDYPIYLDYNATTPCDPQVVEAMLPFFTKHFGNASSMSHAYGWMAEEAVEEARQQVADFLGAKSNEIIFTSGATESCNLAIRGFAEQNKKKGNHIITIATEHKAVLDVCGHLADNGFVVTYVQVDSAGQIDLAELQQAITSQTILIVAMYVNNETGVIHPIREIGKIAKSNGICFFTDATQAFGKINIDVEQDNITMLGMSAHKIYGPKGVGALYIKDKSSTSVISPLFYGGGHEHKLRSGTLNVTGIVGLGKATQLAKQQMDKDALNIQKLSSYFWEGLSNLKGLSINGGQAKRLYNVLNICFDREGGEKLIKILAKKIAVSSGSACSSAITQPSHVLKAMQLDSIKAYSSIRFSFGRYTTIDEINLAIEYLNQSLKK